MSAGKPIHRSSDRTFGGVPSIFIVLPTRIGFRNWVSVGGQSWNVSRWIRLILGRSSRRRLLGAPGVHATVVFSSCLPSCLTFFVSTQRSDVSLDPPLAELIVYESLAVFFNGKTLPRFSPRCPLLVATSVKLKRSVFHFLYLVSLRRSYPPFSQRPINVPSPALFKE